MIDVHCHLTYEGLDKIKKKVIEEAKKEMDAVITCGYPKDAKQNLELGKKHEGFVYVSLGLHPIHIDEMSDKEIEDYLDYVRENADNIVAVGEVGLDWHWFPEEEKKDRFRKVFIQTLDLAKELKKPVVLHMRKAIDEGYEIVKNYGMKDVVFHCYSGGLTLAKKIIENHDNYYISLATNITKSKNSKKIGKRFPLNRITTETDSPFLSPTSEKINVPQNVKFVIKKIAELREMTFEEVDKQLTKTCKKAFRI